MTNNTVRITQEVLETVFGKNPQIGFRLWNGTWWPNNSPREATVVLKHPGALRAMLLPPTEVNMGEAYLYDDFDIEGDVEAAFQAAHPLLEDGLNWRTRLGSALKLLRLPTKRQMEVAPRGRAQMRGRQHSIDRDRQAIAYHYDVSNDFYQLWLDSRMVYSCAYFISPDEDLDTAQARKLDYIARKLRLKPGQRLLDIGCGWGGLIIHAAQHYGVDATGITLSQPQADLANARIAEAGLEDHCRVQIRDYRAMDETESYDALASVGMFEHVGEALLPVYFERAWDLLRPTGVFLNHGIAVHADQEKRPGRRFSDTYVFPDGELVPISTTLRVAEGAHFRVRDVESLREHYALTLRHWVRRLEKHHQEALQFVNEPTYRVWRLFMSASAYGFATGDLNVYQTLLVKPDARGASHLPLSRRDWYQEEETIEIVKQQ
ncbi:MAG: class I SAM-dependent methyltransferase [Anaerolineales bacterium]